MKRSLFFVLFTAALALSAQGFAHDCGSGCPCGKPKPPKSLLLK